MLRKNEGFFLAELLLSLSAWLLATGVLLPLVFTLTNQSYQLQLENVATHILYDELTKMNAENSVADNKSVSRNGVIYEIEWRASTMEVCVTFDGAGREKNEKCKIFE